MPQNPETLKEKYIMQLRRLPDDILKIAYQVELINKRVLCQHDDYISDQYRSFRDLSDDDTDFIVFKIGSFTIKMETEN